MIPINELINRSIIRTDHSEEFLNKMSTEEIYQFENEINEILLGDGVKQNFPEWNASFLAKIIDKSILYKILKDEKNKTLLQRNIKRS